MNQHGSAAIKLVDIEVPNLGDDDLKGPIDGDGDGEDPTLSEIHIDIASNGFLITFVNDFHDSEKVIVTSKEDLVTELRKRICKP